MSTHTQIKEIEHRIRSSLAYHQWVNRNLNPECATCDSKENLQVHHIFEIYHLILGLWKFYGDAETVIEHAISIHSDDRCESVTLCETCHKKIHPARRLANKKEVHVTNWTTFPRKLPGAFLMNSKVSDELGLTLIGFQLLAGFGWLILNGNLQSGMLEFKRGAMAHLLDKEPGTSFNNALERSLNDLQKLDVVIGWHISGPNVEVHLSQTYLENLVLSPWFMSIDDLKTSKMSVLVLRWFLCLQSGRRTYKIGMDKLIPHLCLKTQTPAFVERCVRKAVKDIMWASVDFDGEFFTFRIRRRGATPIWTLREIIADAIFAGQ